MGIFKGFIYLLFQLVMVHITILLFIVYRLIIVSLLTYTAAGTRGSIVWLVPLSLIFPLAYAGYSLILVCRKQYIKSSIIILMLVYTGILFYKFPGNKGKMIENLKVVFIRDKG